MGDETMHAGDVDNFIHEAVAKVVKGLDAATQKLFTEGKTLHKHIFSLMRARDALEKIDEILPKVKASMPPAISIMISSDNFVPK